MKLIRNSAKIEIVENKIIAVGSDIYEDNRNDMILTPNSLIFERERYPLIYEHGKGASDVIGDARTYFDSVRNQYMSEIEVYEENASIARAVKNGAFDSISLAYYVTDYEFVDEGKVLVKSALFKEVSLVSVPADPNAKFVNNSLSDELLKEKAQYLEDVKAVAALKELKGKYN